MDNAQSHAQDTAASKSKAAKRTRTKANTNNDSSSATLPTASTSAVKPSTSHKKRKKKPASKSSTPVAAASSSEEVAAESAPKAKLKVVVRRLPPNVPEAVVWQAVAPWVREEHVQPTVDWKAFVQGKLKDSSRPGTSNDPKAVAHVHSRAYIHFLSLDYLLDFHRNFDGHVFRDAKGNEHTALVEFAPHQKVPVEAGARRKKPDPRQGTIDEDAHYVEFLASLHEKAAETDDAQTTAEKTDAQLMAHMASRSAEASLNAVKARQTPLLEHLRAQRAGRTESSALAAARDYLTRSNPAYNVVSAPPPSDKLGKKKKKKDKASALAARSAADDVGSVTTAATRRPLASAVAATPATTGGEEASGAISINKKKGIRQSKSEVSDARAPDAPSSSASAANAQRGPKTKTAANKSAASASKGKLSDGAPQGDVKVSGGGKMAKKQKAAPQRQAPSPAPAPIAILKRAEPAPSQAAPKPVPAPVAEASIPTGPRADNRGVSNGRGRGAGRRGGKSGGRGGGKAAVVASSSSAGA